MNYEKIKADLLSEKDSIDKDIKSHVNDGCIIPKFLIDRREEILIMLESIQEPKYISAKEDVVSQEIRIEIECPCCKGRFRSILSV